MKRILTALIVCGLLVSATSSVWAQKFELSAGAGWRFGGKFSDGSGQVGTTGLTLGDLNVNAGPSLGAEFGFRLAPTFIITLSYDRQISKITTFDSNSQTEVDVVDLNIDYFMLGFTLQAPEGKLRPYFSFLFGTTYFNPAKNSQHLADPNSETRASGGFGVGVKWFLTDNFGIRGGARMISTFLKSDNEVFCDDNGFCYNYPNSTYMFQGDVGVGVILAF